MLNHGNLVYALYIYPELCESFDDSEFSHTVDFNEGLSTQCHHANTKASCITSGILLIIVCL